MSNFSESSCDPTFSDACDYDSLIDEDIYCCGYLSGTNKEFTQASLFKHITLVRDFNIASLSCDWCFALLALIVFLVLYFKERDIEKCKKPVLVITILGSFIDVIITFTVVGIIDQKGLVDAMDDLYNSRCYSDNITTDILDLKSQFETILILDVVEGVIDIISLLILFMGKFGEEIFDSKQMATCAEGIHGFMFGFFDLLLITVNVAAFVVPSYNTFAYSYSNMDYLCYEHVPTHAPTAQPTASPSFHPTFELFTESILYSENIIDLRSRGNLSYDNYYLPDEAVFDDENGKIINIIKGEDRSFCRECILSPAQIDASIELIGCDSYNTSIAESTQQDSFYNCAGTWLLKTSGRLANWQDTYGRLEIWEIDDLGLKWLKYKQEFNWWNETCIISAANSANSKRCDVLPLTGTTQYAAYFEIPIPKNVTDARTEPFVIVWYDLTLTPYSLRPQLNDEYINITINQIKKGEQFGIDDAWIKLEPAVVSTLVLFGCFGAILLFSCFMRGDRRSKLDFMLDTRNLRTTFRHTPETIIVPPEEIRNRARFHCARHGPWLLVSVVAKLIYMLVFTFTFGVVLLKMMNHQNYKILEAYDEFATERDNAITNLSHLIETHYMEETHRLQQEIQLKEYWCKEYYINLTSEQWNLGSEQQYNNHTQQMQTILDSTETNLRNILLSSGDTSCIKGTALNQSSINQSAFSEFSTHLSSLISSDVALIESSAVSAIKLPFYLEAPIDFDSILLIALIIDLCLLVCRCFRTTDTVTQIVRGKDLDVSVAYLMVQSYKPECCYGRSVMDYCLNCVFYCYDTLHRLSLTLSHLFYWLWCLLKIAAFGIFFTVFYNLVDTVITAEVSRRINDYEMMTAGIDTERRVSNHFIASTTSTYNTYTLPLMQQSIETSIQQLNNDAWTQNIDELSRVSRWNDMFCDTWDQYFNQSTNATTCPTVQFQFWDYNTSTVEVALCPIITPVHGIMYQGFVTQRLNQQLSEAHQPFISAVSNIYLSPFFLVLCATNLLFIAYLSSFLMEWFLRKLDLYRENPFTRVPVVTTDWDQYDMSLHETGETGTIYKGADKDYYNPDVQKPNKGKIEMGLSGAGVGNDTGNDGQKPNKVEIEMGLSGAGVGNDQNDEYEESSVYFEDDYQV